MKSKKTLKIITLIGTFIFAIIAILYGIFHFYYSKLNIKQAEDIVVEYIDESEYIKEEQTEGAIDSSNKEIQEINDNIKNNINNNYNIINNEDVMNILLIGSDTRKKGQAARSDSMMILSINTKTKEITITSLLRDIYVEIPGRGNNKLNAAYAFGGIDLLEETIKNNLYIDIDRYMSVDFFSFVEIVDLLGGIEIDVTDAEIKYINAYLHEINELEGYPIDDDYLTESGLITLDGRQALSYARIRYIGTDFGRTERQRKLLEQIFYKLKDSDIATLNKLCLSVFPLITTDLTESEVLGLLFNMTDYKNYRFITGHIPYDNTYECGTINKMSVISIDFKENIKMFYNNVYKTTEELDYNTVENTGVIQ